MIEKIWNIVRVEDKTATNGNAYLAITVLGDDGKEHKSTVFDASLFQVFKSNKAVVVQLDKPEGKVQWQVKSAVGVAENLSPSVNPNDTEIPQQDEADKALDEAKAILNKPDPRGDPKNRSYALSYAKDWCGLKLQAGVDLKTADVITVAKEFAKYLDNG